MIKYQDNLAARLNGNNLQPLAGASVSVSFTDSGAPATIYADDGVTVLPQPLTTDNNGYFGFKAPDGKYTLTISGVRFATFTRQIVLNDPDDDLDFKQDATGAITRKVQDKLGEVVSVRDFGAKGDGAADDTAAIQAALNRAGVIRVPAGTYVVTGLTVKSDTTIVGDERTAIIKLKDGANNHVFSNVNYVSGTDSNIVFDGLIVDGNVAAQTNNGAYNKHGIRMRGVTGFVFRNGEVRNAGTDCINLINSPYGSVINSRIHGAYNAGIVFENSPGFLAQSNRIYNCGSKTDAYTFQASGHAVIGVNVASDDVRVLGNYVHDMGDSCLRNEAGGVGWVIANNLVMRSGKDSIKIMGKTYNGVRQLYLDNVTNIAVGNTVTSTTTIATGTVTAVDAPTNVITITMGGSASSYASFKLGDAITSSGGGSAVIQSIASTMAKANTVIGNVIVDAGNHAIVANGDAPTVIIGNVIFGTGKNTAGAAQNKWFASAGGIYMSDNSADTLIEGNAISGAYASAVTLDDAYRVTARGNVLAENGENGLIANRCTFLTLHDNIVYDNSKRVANTYSGVYVADFGGAAGAVYSRHSIKGNRIFNTTSVGQLYGLRLEGGAKVSNSTVKYNDVFGSTNAAQIFFNWSGVGNVIARNDGYATEGRGTATVASGTTLATVTHGLRIQPTADKISVTPTNSMGTATKYWIGAISSSSFQIFVNADPGATTATFAWQVSE